MLRVALSLVAIAAALAGCGGSGEPSVEDDAATLRAYFAEMKPIHAKVTETSAAAGNALRAIAQTPDATWRRATGRVRTATRELIRAGDELDTVAAPPRLVDEHRSYTQAVDIVRQLFEQILDPLERRDISTLQIAAGKVPAALADARAFTSEWQQAVAAEAKRTGVAVPAWAQPGG